MNRGLKLEILREILKQDSPFDYQKDSNGIMCFLVSVWDLRALPSTDERYSDA